MAGLVAVAVARGEAQPAAPAPTDGALERPFAAGGLVRLDLSAGEYRIEGVSADKILVRWRTRRPEDARRVRVEVEARDKTARVATHGPRRGGFEVEIQVPSRSDLDLDLSAGDLTIREIRGNKNVEVWAGDVSIEIGEVDAYRRVDAAVNVGELAARPFNVTKGGLFRSFRWQGRGGYELRARLFAGDLKLLR